MVDTADAYQNEELVGRTIRGRRDEVLLATKFGLVWRDRGRRWLRRPCRSGLRAAGVRGEPATAWRRRDRPVLPAPPQRADADRGDRCSHGRPCRPGKGARPGTVQRHGGGPTPRARRPPDCGASRAVVAEPTRHRTPAAAGRGRARDGCGGPLPHWSWTACTRLAAHPTTGRTACVPPWREIAVTHDAEAGQVALAWVHHRQQVHGVPVVPIPGTTSISHLRSNVAAADLRLTGDELRRLDSLGAAS